MSLHVLMTVLSAAMLIAAFPPFNLGFLAWIAMVPFFFVLSGKKSGSTFILSLFWGIIFFAGTVYWVVNSMTSYGGIPFFTSILILFLLVIALSLFLAVFGFAASKILASEKTGLLLKIFTVSSLWVSLEYIRGNLILGGFPWVLLAYSQHSFLSLIQVVDITGVYGVSFLIVSMNLFLFYLLSYWFGRVAKPPIAEGAVVSVILIVILLYGITTIARTDTSSAAWKNLRVGIAQGNIDQGRKWDISFQKETVEIYKKLSFELGQAGAELIIWPETAVPFYLQSEEELGYLVFDIPMETGAYLFTGSPAYSGYGDGTRYYNSAFLISPKNEIIGRYDKIHLVPFGEYVPFKKYLPFISKLVVGVGDFSPGKTHRPLEFDGRSFATLICFESIFPDLARKSAGQDAGFLINITNDAWFGRTSAPYQHFAQSIFRAVENRLFLIRAANTGISGVVDSVGRVRLSGGIFTQETLLDVVKIREGNLFTFYSRYGDIFAIGCITYIIMFAVWYLSPYMPYGILRQNRFSQ